MLKPLVVCLALLAAAPAAAEPPLFTLDDDTWVLFYDLPSRRFRTIRDAFIKGDLDAAAADLRASAGFIAAEAGRAEPALRQPLGEVVARGRQLADSLAEPTITVADLDAHFARAHWLLAQHYLVQAGNARNDGRHRTAGHYLWATAHHMERAVLWSDARLSPDLARNLEDLRTMADELRRSDRPENVYRRRPVVTARKTLEALGEFLDRRIWTEPTPPRP